MQIYEFIANLFFLAISLVLILMSLFFIYIIGDTVLERKGLSVAHRDLIMAAIMVIIIVALY